MADPQIVSEWLKKADEDLGFAISVIEDSTFYAQICFHFHQAAEKYLKSFIIARDLEFKKIHDLTVLLKSCLGKKPDLRILMGIRQRRWQDSWGLAAWVLRKQL